MRIWESQNAFNLSLDKAIKGSRIEQGKFKEAITSDQLAPFFNAAIQPEFEDAYASLKDEQVFPKIAQTRLLNDFRPAAFVSLQSEGDVQLIDNGGYATPEGTLPAIPELSPYPTFGWSASGRWIDTKKHGARMDFSFEAFINDQWEIIEAFPAEAARLARRTEDVAVFLQLLSGTGLRTDVFDDSLGTVLQQTTAPDFLSGPVAKNAPLSHDALLAAIHQINTIKRKGHTVTVPNGFVLLVPTALENLADMIVNTITIEVTQGSKKYVLNNTLPNKVEVVATPWMSDLAGGSNTNWILLPKGGKTAAKTTLVKTGLRGYETPELRVSNNTGLYLGGGTPAYTEGSFDNDSAQSRVRMITGSGLVNLDGIVGSTGLGA